MVGSAVHRSVRLAVALLLVATLVAPMSSAQPTPPNQPSLSGFLSDPGHAMSPGGNESIEMKVTYQWGSGSAPGPQPDLGDLTNSSPAPTKITYKPKLVPTWVESVTFQPPMLNATYGGPGFVWSGTVNVILHIKRDAPANNRQNVTIDLLADANGATPGAQATTPELMLHPGNTPVVTVKAKEDLAKVIVKGGRATPITFIVTNMGNGEVTVQLNVTSRPQDSIVEDLPPVITLQANQSLPVDVMLRIPWTYGEEGTLTLEATPLAGEETGKTAAANVDIAGESAVPGFELPVLVAALGALALLRRRA